ncbi:MAG: ATP-dependent DNA helicase RecG [Chloroflexi bacterium]|nr:ATP-dependent DNA helicase RecG [Chloroflexota bacterium]
MRNGESSTSKLEKFLSLERRQNFQDRAVMGGLEESLRRWAKEAGEESPADQQPIIEEIASFFVGYGRRDGAGRAQAVEAALSRLSGLKAMASSGQDSGLLVEASQASQRQTQEGPPTYRVRPAEDGRPIVPPRPRPVGLDSPVTVLSGVSGAYSGKLRRLGIEHIRDLLFLFPRRYNDYTRIKLVRDLRAGQVETVVGTIWEISKSQTKSGKLIVKAIVADESGTIEAVWWNQPYLLNTLTRGKQVVLSGKVDYFLGRLTFASPEWEFLETPELIHTARLAPVYPLTEDLGERWLRRLQSRTVARWAAELVDYLPDSVRARQDLLDLGTALCQIHFPDNWESLARARRRLAFDEFFLLQLGVLAKRRDWQEGQLVTPMKVDPEVVQGFVDSLPFALTKEQKRALGDILDDLARPVPMARLLQGEVGSGKTVVAILAMLVAVANGYQSAMMAPTEILAEQHYRTIQGVLQAIGSKVDQAAQARLLTGSLAKAEKESLREDIGQGRVNIVIGTHALIQEGVDFQSLGLAVIDEQHRFGVMQRLRLASKGGRPHLLVMTATPIPQTIALTIFGDLDISTIAELPPGRQRVKTYFLEPRQRERAYNFIRSQVEKGRQAFVICPLIEESETQEARAAVQEFERLQREVFPDLRLGLLHGRMKSQEKDSVLQGFRQGLVDVLVSTPVVEVGIDVPNATVMLVEGAERFGLAQLHQFRGRVGRGTLESCCVLLSDSNEPEAMERLRIIEDTYDGFSLAEKDLELRGPGQFFDRSQVGLNGEEGRLGEFSGVRQSGRWELRAARVSDVAILELARREAQAVFQQDPKLSLPEHRLLAQKVTDFWQKAGDLS